MQVQYRNCNYIGEFQPQQYERNGYGLMILDNSHIIMGKWKADALNGPFVMITERMRILGTMANNKLEGYNVISMQQSLTSNKKQKERTIYGMFRDNKLYGKAIVIDDEQVIIAHYTNGELRQISDKKPIREREVYQMLQLCFPNEIYTIVDWLNHIFSQAGRQFSNDSDSKFKPIYKQYEDDVHFYGFTEVFNKDKGIGFIMHHGQVLSIGQHDKDFLDGLGRAYHSDGTVEDGVFKQGELNGIGIKYSKVNHKYILGEHNQQNQTFEKGFGFPQKQINQIRKQFHLRSIYFYNDIVLFHFSTIFQAICTNCLHSKAENESPRFSSVTGNSFQLQNQRRRGLSQKSPLRAKIQQYEHQSDDIDEPSPIKNKPINQYQRTDLRKNKYFGNDRDEENYQKTQIQQRSTNYKNNARSRSRTQKVQETYLRKEASPSKAKLSASKIRDTKQLVRELDEKQRTRRGYLDQIYKQAKLYSRKN